MGCGASSPSKNVDTTDRFRDKDSSERNQRKREVLERYRLSEKDKSRIILYPIFKIPKKHAIGEHLIECAFFGVKDESYTEVTLFFRDEGCESEIVERKGLNFCLIKDDTRQNYQKIAFNHCWSADETWETPQNDESHSHWCSWSEVEKENHAPSTVPRPVLYINTATHLLGIENNNSDLETATFTEYEMYAGTARQATDILLKASEAANPDKKHISALAQLIPVKTTHAPPKTAKKEDKEKKSTSVK
jgi:hypothetical protein